MTEEIRLLCKIAGVETKTQHDIKYFHELMGLFKNNPYGESFCIFVPTNGSDTEYRNAIGRLLESCRIHSSDPTG